MRSRMKQQLRQYASKEAAPRRRKSPIIVASFFVFINAWAIYTHFDDDTYFYQYPFPFALDVGNGPSMLPTMDVQGGLYYRDCWSHRVVWLNVNNLQKCMRSLLLSQQSTDASLRRPWQKGDVVTFYNPFTKGLATKRIIGVAGDTVQVFGEHASDYRALKGEGIACGVPDDPQFSVPFCRRTSFKQNLTNGSRQHAKTTIVVPPNHVWVEGDNPLWSRDSRHFGPLPESSLRGRVVMRFYPINQAEGLAQEMLVNSERPAPYMNNEWLENERYSAQRRNID